MKTTQVESFDIALDVTSPEIERFDFLTENEPLNISAGFKQRPEDFNVEEQLKFELSGEGQHLCVFVEKRLLNTLQVVTMLARFFAVAPRAIGYLGMKDKVAITRQWFSIDLAESKFDESRLQQFEELKSDFIQNLPDMLPASKKAVSVKVLDFKFNQKKLRVGQLKGNRFELVLRNIVSENTKDFEELGSLLDNRLNYIKEHGFPNYFGEQRFGRQQQNIQQLTRFTRLNLEKRRAVRSRLLSTARALGFNCYLSERVKLSSFRTYLSGDVLQFSDGKTVFNDVQNLEEVQRRLKQHEVIITGPLFAGEDSSMAASESLELEQRIKNQLGSLLDVLKRFDAKAARRALLAQPKNMTWYFSANDLFLQFELDAGSFASVLVRELIDNLKLQGPSE